MSARVYKSFGGEAWKRNIVMTPILIPGTVFAVFFLLNLFVWAKGSSGAVPFSTMLALLLIWFVISIPLSFAGSWVGFKQRVGFYLLSFGNTRVSQLVVSADSHFLYRQLKDQPRRI